MGIVTNREVPLTVLILADLQLGPAAGIIIIKLPHYLV